MSDEERERFARQIRGLLIARYGTMACAAKAMGVHPQVLSRIVHSPQNRKLCSLEKVASALGMKIVFRNCDPSMGPDIEI